MRRTPLLLYALFGCAAQQSPAVTSGPSLDHPRHGFVKGEREVHLSSDGGLAGPYPTIRLYVRAGRVTGDVIVEAPSFGVEPADSAALWRDTLSAQYRQRLGARYACQTWRPPARRNGDWLCRAGFTRGEPEWQGILARIDSLVSASRPTEPPPDWARVVDSLGRVTRITGCTDGTGWTVSIWDHNGPRVIEPPETLPGCG